MDVLLINSIFEVLMLLFEVTHIYNSTADADADTGINTTDLQSSVRLSDPRQVLMTHYISVLIWFS
jgi:hypothetical protein